MCCSKYQFTTRHDAVTAWLTNTLRQCHMRVENEVAVEGKKRPADVLITRWSNGGPLAIDVTVTHPLAPGLGLNAQASKDVLLQKERNKIKKNLPICQRAHLSFVPFPLTTFGELSPVATKLSCLLKWWTCTPRCMAKTPPLSAINSTRASNLP